jgi:hypothetical protein
MLSFYGVLPRLVCCVLAHYCLKHHLGSSFKTLPGASDVLARMRSPIIESITRDQQETVPDSDESKTPATPGFDPQSAKAFLSWNKAHLASADFRDPEKTPVTSIGAPHTVEEDKTALDAFTTQHAKVSPLILTKSWEPPTGEFLDLVSELRKRLPSHCPIFILPIATDNDQAYLIDIAIWKRSLRKLADPYLTVIQQSKEKDRL